jgi:hypothetical protein
MRCLRKILYHIPWPVKSHSRSNLTRTKILKWALCLELKSHHCCTLGVAQFKELSISAVTVPFAKQWYAVITLTGSKAYTDLHFTHLASSNFLHVERSFAHEVTWLPMDCFSIRYSKFIVYSLVHVTSLQIVRRKRIKLNLLYEWARKRSENVSARAALLDMIKVKQKTHDFRHSPEQWVADSTMMIIKVELRDPKFGTSK